MKKPDPQLIALFNEILDASRLSTVQKAEFRQRLTAITDPDALVVADFWQRIAEVSAKHEALKKAERSTWSKGLDGPEDCGWPKGRR